MARIAVVTVQFNNPDDTLTLLRSIASAQHVNELSVTIVDNSTDPSKRISAAQAESTNGVRAEILTTSTNLYYWGGAAFAIERFKKRGALFDWVVICNNDVSFTDPDFFDRLAEYDPDSHPIIAPRIIASRGDQNPLLERAPRVFTRAKWGLYDSGFVVARSMLAVHSALGRVTGAINKPASDPGPARRIYAPHGACVILSRRFFERGGRLDVSVHLFAEELTLASWANRLRVPVWFDPSLTVVHREHTTTGRGLTRQKYQLERAARRRYYELERIR